MDRKGCGEIDAQIFYEQEAVHSSFFRRRGGRSHQDLFVKKIIRRNYIQIYSTDSWV